MLVAYGIYECQVTAVNDENKVLFAKAVFVADFDPKLRRWGRNGFDGGYCLLWFTNKDNVFALEQTYREHLETRGLRIQEENIIPQAQLGHVELDETMFD